MKDRKEYQHQYYMEDRERLLKAMHERYEANKEERRAKAREYARQQKRLAMEAYFKVFMED